MDIIKAVELAVRKENEGITYLYESTYQKNYYVALKYVKNEELAKDVLQDAYIKAFANIEQLNNALHFESWMSQIVARTALNELRKNNPILFSETENEEGQTIDETFEDDRVEVQPEIVMDKEETSRLVREMMADLTDEQRMCITMFYMENMSVKEIAETIEVSENTVKSRLNYGRQKIKDKVLLLEKQGTKLYSIAPVPFFAMLIKMELAKSTVAVPAMSAAASGSTSAATTAGGSSATVATGAKVAAGITAKHIVAGVAALAVVGGTAAGIIIHNKAQEPDLTIEACPIAVDGNYVYYPEKNHVYKFNLETQEKEEILSNDENQEYLEVAYDGDYLYTVESYMWDMGIDDVEIINPEADTKSITKSAVSPGADGGIDEYYDEPEGDDGYPYGEPEGDDGYPYGEPEGDDGYMYDEPEGDDGYMYDEPEGDVGNVEDYDAQWDEEENSCKIYRYDLKTMDKKLLGRGTELIIDNGMIYYLSLEEEHESVVSVDLKTGKKEILVETKDEADLKLPDNYIIVEKKLFFKDSQLYICYDYMEGISFSEDFSISGGQEWGYKAFDMDGNEVNIEDFGITVLKPLEYEKSEMAAEFGAEKLNKYEQTYDGWTYVDTFDHKFIVNDEGEKIQLD